MDAWMKMRIKTCVELKRTWFWQQFIKGNPQKALPYQCGLKRRNLCLSVKVSIICADTLLNEDTLLNKGTELQSRTKYLEQNGKIW